MKKRKKEILHNKEQSIVRSTEQSSVQFSVQSTEQSSVQSTVQSNDTYVWRWYTFRPCHWCLCIFCI